MTVYVSIGNSDDKLTQREWNQFWLEVAGVLAPAMKEIRGIWFSDSTSAYQNACWAFEPWPQVTAQAQDDLRLLAAKWRQDAIVWDETSSTRFIGPAEVDPDPELNRRWGGGKAGRQPWILFTPPGTHTDRIPGAELVKLLPGDHGIVVMPGELYEGPVPLTKEP